MKTLANRLVSSLAIAMMVAIAAPAVHAQKAAPATAQAAANPLQIKLVRTKVAVENGAEVMQNADLAKPGDMLQEIATYTNTSKGALKNVQATLPVPLYTEFVLASANPATALASTDGVTFAKMPLSRKVRQPNGVTVEQPVPISEYRYLRWAAGELQPDKPVSFSARFKLSNTPVVANSTAK